MLLTAGDGGDRSLISEYGVQPEPLPPPDHRCRRHLAASSGAQAA